MINYKHLRYFWMVAKEGSIAKASKLLFLAPQTISGQLSQLEDQLDVKLFQRVGRNLQLTDKGKIVQNYANDIFSLGHELQEVLHNKSGQIKLQLKAGIANSIPKSIAYHLLEPALYLSEPIHLICREDNLTALLSELITHKLDIVIADRPLPDALRVKGFSYHLGQCGVSFFCTNALITQLQGEFPYCLDNMPLLLPGDSSAIKNKLILWFQRHDIYPCIIAEFDDGALMKAFGQRGTGIFIAPSIIATEVETTFNVKVIGQTTEVIESFYAISIERKAKHLGVLAILNSAKERFLTE
jgi:LysR family transcriptional activator of nhaA